MLGLPLAKRGAYVLVLEGCWRPPLVPWVQRRLFFGAPLPPLDPAFSFSEPGA